MLRITVSSSSGCSAPAATPVESGVAGDEIQPATSVYEAVDNFVIDLKFEGKYEVITEGATDPETGLAGPSTTSYVYSNAYNVTSDFDFSQYDVVMSKPNAYTVRLTGPGLNVFSDQYYKFTLTDFTQAILPPNTDIPFLSLNRYKKPANNSTVIPYTFNVTIPTTQGASYPSVTTSSTTVNHTYWWNFPTAASNIARLKSQGLR